MPRIEFAVMADRAEHLNGKLYMAGGCWDRITVRGEQHAAILSLAVSVLVEPENLGTQHIANIVIGAVGEDPRVAIQVQFQANPPAGAFGLPFSRALLTVVAMPITFPV